MARHGFVVRMVERSDESLSIWELVDQHAIPIALTDEIAFGRCKEQCGAADLFCRESEGFGVTNIGVFKYQARCLQTLGDAWKDLDVVARDKLAEWIGPNASILSTNV